MEQQELKQQELEQQAQAQPKKRSVTVRTLTMCAIFTAVTVVLSQIAIPMPSGVPITLQTLAIALCGYTLGARRGAAAVGIYLLLGLIGIPVFSGFSGGAAKLVSYTGGFLIGFLPFAALCGLPEKDMRAWVRLPLGLVGLAVCHLLGAAQFAVLTKQSLGAALLVVSVPYLVKDVVSVVAAYLFAQVLCRSVPQLKRMHAKDSL